MSEPPTPSLVTSLVTGGYRLDARRWSRSLTTEKDTHSPQDAISELGKQGVLRHLVVGVIGPREATDAQLCVAEHVGRALAELGVTIVCGGRSGVMEAVSKGCSEAGGLVIGLLPGSAPEDANAYVGVPLPTGLGEARNMVIAKAYRVLIAIGNSYGTLSEVAYGLHFGKQVIGLEQAADLHGVVHVATVDAALQHVAFALIDSAPIVPRLDAI